MSTLQPVELGVLGPLQVRRAGTPVMIPGGKPRAILTMLGLHSGSVVSAETLIELLWGDDPPRTAAKALQTHISAVRRTLGDGFVLTEGVGWTLAESEVDASRYKSAARLGRDAAAAGDTSQAMNRFEEALALWRGAPELPDGRRGKSEKTRWVEGHAALVEDRADALLATGRAAEIIGELEAAVADAPLRERRWGQLMLALYRAGRQGEALGAYQRARALLADELGIDPGPDLRRLETAIVGQDTALEIPAAQDLPSVTRTVTFLLTDIEGSTAAWEADADAMAVALARHDELVEQIVTSRGGRLIKTRGEGDATFSVFERASAATAAAIELQDAIFHEPWGLKDPMRIRVALHTGEVELRDGDYFGRAVNRAARLRSLAIGGQILCSGAIAELVIDALPDDVVLADLGMRQLKNLARPEHVFELRLETAARPQETNDAPLERPALPAVLTGPGPFVGRGRELERLVSAWQIALTGGMHAVLIAGEPGVGKTRLAGEWSQQAFNQGAVVLYGRCDEDLGAPYQPFAEALRSLVPCVGDKRLRGLRGVEALLPLVPGLTDVLPDLATPTRADPDTERYALFDAVVALLELASTSAPVVLILDDLHWAAKPTLLLLRHLLRFGDRARVQIVGTYRSTDLDRSHPLAAMLADLHRGAGSGTANRLTLGGLDEDDVTAYVTEAGYNDEELGRALASVTGGNPFFLIEALRHVDETGGVWDPTTLPQGVRETVSRRLSRLPAETNTALAAAAVVGSRFALDVVEKVLEQDLVDAFDGACKAGIVIEEPGGRYRFNHAIVRQSLLAELPSVRRLRLHQRIATMLENEPGADDELLAELAHHYFECAWAGNAAKAVEYCRRAADQAVARLAYEGAADLYGQALHALEEIDDELPDRDEQAAELLVARCEALLAAGDVASAAGAVSQLQDATVNSARLAAWATCFDGQLSMLVHPERLDEVETALRSAAQKLAELDDAAGEANAHTVRAACLARLGRIGDGEIALDDALTAARRARDHRRVNAVLAGAPLAALWGPNPVPRAGGRCLDVVRLLRITTDSPAVEATSTRCQAVLEAFRGRGAAARRMIDSARRTVTELGLRHALLEVEQFAGIVELIDDDPTAAEGHFRQAYNGFRRMGLDADTAETAALLGRTCLALDRDAEANELCLESERLAGHALKASIAWRALRAQLLSRGNDHEEARRIAEAAVGLAERTDALVDHGDACFTLATVLGTAGDVAGARAAGERAVDLYERKGAAALADMTRRILGEQHPPSVPTPPEPPPAVELDNAAARTSKRVIAAIHRDAWDEVEELYAPEGLVESRRKIVGFPPTDLSPAAWAHQSRRVAENGAIRFDPVFVAVRGERLALARVVVGNADVSPGAPQDEFLSLSGIDEEGRIALQVWFDVEDMDAAVAELDAAHARFEQEAHRRARRLDNAASQAADRYMAHFAARDWDELAKVLADDVSVDDRRRVVNAGIKHGRDVEIANLRAAADVGITYFTYDGIAARGEYLILARVSGGEGGGSGEFLNEVLGILEINSHNQIAAIVLFDVDDIDAAYAELEARYLAGEGAAHARTWSAIAGVFVAHNRREIAATTPDAVSIDHRRGAAFAPGQGTEYLRAGWDLDQTLNIYIETAPRVNDLGAVFTWVGFGTSHEGFDAEWRGVEIITVDGDLVSRAEVFDEADLDIALAKFDQLSRPAPRLENAASRAVVHYLAHFAARDWDASAKVLADDICVDDRRRVVNAGIKHGRDAEIATLRAFVDVGITYLASVVIAARGQRLILARVSGGEGGGFGEFLEEVLGVIEVNSHNQIAGIVLFELDDFDSAVAELDARYIAGEAAAHAHIWSVIVDSFASASRRELPAMTPDCVTIDHRRAAAFAPGEGGAYFHASWELAADLNVYIEAVHRLSDLGAVFTHVGNGASRDGFEAEWRAVDINTVEGDLISRGELFDESDVDTALAKFEQLSRPVPRLENAASQAAERLRGCFASRDWHGLAEVLAEDILADDRRRVVGIGIRRGRQANVADIRAGAEVGAEDITSTVIATRGERIALDRARFYASDQQPQALNSELLRIVEVDTDSRMTCCLMFDPDDFDDAMAELDARYLAGEAASHTRTWSLVARAFASINRHELPELTPDWVNIDHRRGAAFAPGDMTIFVYDLFEDAPDITVYIEAVHRLSNLGVVVTHRAHGTSQGGFEAEWRELAIFTFEGDLLSRCELFDEAALDTALARFEQLSRPAPRVENAASQAGDRYVAHFIDRDWDELAKVLADDVCVDDRRRIVNAGIRHGRDAEIANLRATADVGITHMTFVAIAARGDRLVLSRTSGGIRGSGEFLSEVLGVVEINSHNEIAAMVLFDLDDFDTALAELDARYLAGEAAPHARTWSGITRAYAAINRHELPELTPDWVNIDHRRGAAFAPGDMSAFLHDLFEDLPDIIVYIEAVHRLSNFGVVVTQRAHGTSHKGFEAEWHEVGIAMFEDDLMCRIELFDDADVDAAIARFDQLSPATPRLENTATRVQERVYSYIAAGDWDAVAQTTADNVSVDDRRRVVNAGVLHGRDANIKSTHATVDVGFTMTMVGTLATRGGHLALIRVRVSGRDPGVIQNDALTIVEIDADERIAGNVVFDLDDFDAAIAELDARYLAGEAAGHASTWSVITGFFTAHNRRQIGATTPDVVTIDHRRAAGFAPGKGIEYIRAGWDLGQDINIYIEIGHRLNDLGAVFTWAGDGTSDDGFDAEWRGVTVMTVDGEMFSRMEVFDETDLDTAIVRFDQLSRPKPLLENVASRITESILTSIADGDLTVLADRFATDYSLDDRRRVVNSGTRQGGNTAIEDLRIAADMGLTDVKSTVVAIRGDRLVLTRARWSGRDQGAEAFHLDAFQLIVIDSDERVTAVIGFDLDDVDAAFAELDAQYLAGEAATHSQTWSVIARECTAFNRHEPNELIAADYVTVDHRPLPIIEAGDMGALWDVMPDFRIHIEAVHRLSDFGAVATYTAYGTSPEGFNGEWRMIFLLTVDGDRINQLEIYDDTGLDAALARFEELRPQAPRPENAAGRILERYQACFSARDWAAMAELLAEDMVLDDRRRVVNAGVRRGRDAHLADTRAGVEVGAGTVSFSVIATRGERLALAHARAFNRGSPPGEVGAEWCGIAEIDADARIVAMFVFDLDDIDAAYEELDARYLAGEAAAHSHAWAAIMQTYAAYKRHELPAADWVNVDHRRGTPFANSDLTAVIRGWLELTPDFSMHIEAVHQLNNVGAVITHTSSGISQDGFDAAWRMIQLLNVENDRISRCELFDETDLDAALARFDELRPRARRLENAASVVVERFWKIFETCDWAAMAEAMTEDYCTQDRRRVVNAGDLRGRAAHVRNMQAVAEVGFGGLTSTVMAMRGQRIALIRIRSSVRGSAPGEVTAEMLSVTETDTDNRLAAAVIFDSDDIDAAFEELDARYLAGEAATCAHAWSVIAQTYAMFNQHVLPAMDLVTIDHRRGTPFAPGDLTAAMRLSRDLTPDLTIYVEAVHRLSNFGAVITNTADGTSKEGFDAEWRTIQLLTVEGDRINSLEIFDEADLDAALARFDELSRSTPSCGNAATRTWARVADAFNRRDGDALLALGNAFHRYEDRRKGLRDVVEAPERRKALDAMFETAPPGWRMEVEPIAIRGSGLSLTRARYRDTDETDRPIAVELLHVMELGDDDLMHETVIFDPDDINDAFAELTARWIASGEVAYPKVIESVDRINAAINRRDWDAAATHFAGADYVDHRQPAHAIRGTIVDWLSSMQTTGSLVPDLRVELAEVLARSAIGIAGRMTPTGTSTDVGAIESPFVALILIDGERVTRLEVFDDDQRDMALARLQELNRPV